MDASKDKSGRPEAAVTKLLNERCTTGGDRFGTHEPMLGHLRSILEFPGLACFPFAGINWFLVTRHGPDGECELNSDL